MTLAMAQILNLLDVFFRIFRSMSNAGLISIFFENSFFYFLIFLHFKLFVFELFFQFRFFRKFGLISFFPIILYEFNFFLNSCLISFSLDKISNFRTKINILICAKKSFFLSFNILLILWQNRSKMSNGVRHFTHSTFYSFCFWCHSTFYYIRHFTHSTFYSFYDKIVVKCRMAFDIFLIRHFTHSTFYSCTEFLLQHHSLLQRLFVVLNCCNKGWLTVYYQKKWF